jgi:hypothetical protein
MKRRFRWKRLVQIRLATLLVLVTVFGAFLGFRQAYIISYRRQHAAIERITNAGGSIQFSAARALKPQALQRQPHPRHARRG